MSGPETVFALTVATLAFLVSASVGLGGSLILVPALLLVLGAKEAVAVAALLLALNNFAKLAVYVRTIPWRESAGVVLLTVVGSFVGASLLVGVSDRFVHIAAILSIAFSLMVERLQLRMPSRLDARTLALGSGLTSGVSGTSGPLKGVALRRLELDRAHLVGAAAVVSLAADLSKTAVFASNDLLSGDSATLAATAIPLMVLATAAGRHINRAIGDRGYAVLFWSVMVAYCVRLAL